jgi:hypothetical protein
MMLQNRVLSRRLNGSKGEKIVKVRGRIEGRAAGFSHWFKAVAYPYNRRTIN